MGLGPSKPPTPRLERDSKGHAIPPKSKGFGNWQQRLANRQANRSNRTPVPQVPHFPEDRFTLLKLNRVKDWLALEEELCQRLMLHHDRKDPFDGQVHSVGDKKLVEKLVDSRLIVGDLEDIIDDEHCIVSLHNGMSLYYCPLLSLVDKDLLYPNASVLISTFGFAVVGVLDEETTNNASSFVIEDLPRESYHDIG